MVYFSYKCGWYQSKSLDMTRRKGLEEYEYHSEKSNKFHSFIKKKMEKYVN